MGDDQNQCYDFKDDKSFWNVFVYFQDVFIDLSLWLLNLDMPSARFSCLLRQIIVAER